MRRLDYSKRTRYPSDPPLNPFEWAETPARLRPFRVCLHTAGLAEVPRSERLALWQLTHLRSLDFEAFRTPGDDGALSCPAVRVIEDAAADVAYVRYHRDANTEEMSHLDGLRAATAAAERVFGDPEARWRVLEALVGESIAADLFVTLDTTLLAASAKLGAANVVTPNEALAILGPWSRATNRAFVGLIGLNRGFYYRALGGALTPGLHSGLAAMSGLEYRVPEGELLGDLGQSILSRIDALTQGLDRMVASWQLPTNNDRLDEPADEFDKCVLVSNAILDTLARLVGTYLSIPAGRDLDWTLRSRWWQREVGRAGPAGAAVRAYVEEHLPHVELSLQLRHHAIHRERVRTLTVQDAREPKVTRLAVRGDLLVWTRERLSGITQHSAAWGLGRTHSPARVPVSQHGRRGVTRDEIDEPEWAELDPLPFAVRLVAQTAAVVNEMVPLLGADEDGRLPKEWREEFDARPGPEFPFRAQDGQLAVLLSPLSGLVDYAQPTVDAWTASDAALHV